MTYKIYIPLFLIIIFTCSNTNKEKKKYQLIVVEEVIHNEIYNVIEINEDNEKVIVHEDKRYFSQIAMCTYDSIYVGLTFTNDIPDYYFYLYTIEKVDTYSSILKMEESNNVSRLLVNIDTQKNILQINENIYHLNASYCEYLLEEGFRKNVIFPFINFINTYIDDFYDFHFLSETQWIKKSIPAGYQIRYAEIQTVHPQIKDKFHTWHVEYIYENNHLTEIKKYLEDDLANPWYHYKVIKHTPEYEQYEYAYNDDISRFCEEGKGSIEKHPFRKSTFTSIFNFQRGMLDETQKETTNYKVFPLDKLNITPEEIHTLITIENK